MRRREFITLVGAAAASPLAARAQEPGRIYHLGSLVGSQRTAPYHVAFFEALRQSGFVEGQNLLADPHGYGLRVDQFAGHAAEVVDARVDVIIGAGKQPFAPHRRRRKPFQSSAVPKIWLPPV
jgi:putative ABC transport system substrate-binding protein